ncbi:MAG: hypothetical protein L0G94_03620 [Brachybacterium sp.]|uniref:Mur ligase family protein n=1 Tax=Brachybacterium sp. TaxID=1891286 RepID=UPI002647CB8D|nr:Mur ligase family protein [Brachybacterium sp.]MDN5685760.1 hypothetical protein [Brachybacterium sp.]
MIEYQARAGATAMSLEAFVGTLADGLFERVEVDTAVCTGLERDHLDVHGSIEAYWGAKLSLFEEHLRPDGVAVMATDCAQGERVRAGVAVMVTDCAQGERVRAGVAVMVTDCAQGERVRAAVQRRGARSSGSSSR